MHKLLFLNRFRWFYRCPAKTAILGFTILAVCFPHPGVLLRHVQHWRDPNALIEPEAEALQPLMAELNERLSDELSAEETLKVVERFVYERIPYRWDWETWGNADYLPTVTETIERGHEDCDGRAVVAASMLAKLGFEARIVTDFAHVWVKTKRGETMGPGKKKAVVAEADGLKVQVSALTELPRALAFGIAPFPLVRELIVLVVLWWLFLRTDGRLVRSLAALAVLTIGLLLLRAGGRNYFQPNVLLQAVGVLALVVGLVLLLVRNRTTLASCDTPPAAGAPESP